MSYFKIGATPFARPTPRRRLVLLTALALGAQLPGLAMAATPAQPVHAIAETGQYVPARTMELKQRGDVQEVFRDQRRSFLTHPFESSGYWADQGETLIVRYTPHGAQHPNVGPQLWIVPVYGQRDTKARDQIVQLKEGVNTITVEHAGTINFAAPNEPFGGTIEVAIQDGGHPIPHFVLGKHTNADWNEMLAAFPDAPYGELIGKRMSIALPLATLKQVVDDPTLVLQTWDRIVDAAEEQYGLSATNARPHEATPFTYQVSSKPDSTGGYMSASDYWLRTNISGARDVANAAALESGGWGPWHELGHHYQLPSITWGGQEEVTVNLTSLYVQRMLGRTSRLETGKVWPKVFAYLANTERTYEKMSDLFVRVAMYWQLDLAFGKDFYARFAASVRALPYADLPKTDAQKKQFLILQASRVSGHDLTPFFEKWGLPADADTARAIQSLGVKPLDKPIWENRDSAIEYTYSAAEQNVAGQVEVPAEVRAGGTFVAQVNTGNRDASKLTYEWHVPEGFTADASNSPRITLKAPLNALQNASAPIRVTVSDGRQSMLLGSVVKLKTDGPPLSAVQAFERSLLAAHGKSEALKWSGVGKGTPGDIYIYHNGYRGTIDYFRLKTRDYWYFPTNHQSNGDWEYLASFDGSQYLSAGAEPEPVLQLRENSAVTASSGVVRAQGSDSARSTTAQQNVKVGSTVAPKPVEAKITGPADVEAGTRVELSAGTSRNPNGTPLTYHWIVPPLLGGDTDMARVRLHVPIGAKAGSRYTVKLTAYDSLNRLSSTADHTLTIKASAKPSPEPVPGPDAYPAYQPGAAYRGGDRVLNAGRVYECKPLPHSDWCGKAPAKYAPGKGKAWRDAWIEKR